MSSVCVLTDNTAQFSKPAFPGRDLITTIPLTVQYNGIQYTDSKDFKVSNLPPSLQKVSAPVLIPPSVEDFRKQFLQLGRNYNEIVAVLLSSQLSPTIEHAMEAAEAVRGRVAVQVIDSQTTSVGLGMLVQSAAEAATEGVASTEIERLLRGLIPHIYSVFCIPGLTYLNCSGFIGAAQAIAGEMLSLLPIYTLEDGRLTPIEKARNYRQLMDFLQEFVDEFSDLYHIAFIQSVPPMIHEARTLREHAATNFPKTPFSEHSISLPLAVLMGPRTLAVFAIEDTGEKDI
jgi:DegV family protein with EDD domain